MVHPVAIKYDVMVDNQTVKYKIRIPTQLRKKAEKIYRKFKRVSNPKNTSYTRVLTLLNKGEKNEEKSTGFVFKGIHYYYYMHRIGQQ